MTDHEYLTLAEAALTAIERVSGQGGGRYRVRA